MRRDVLGRGLFGTDDDRADERKVGIAAARVTEIARTVKMVALLIAKLGLRIGGKPSLGYQRERPMLYKAISIAVVATLVTAAPAAAEQGKYSSALRTMLNATAAGTCPADLMGDKLLTACKEQMPRMQPEMIALGPVKTLKFLSAVGGGDQRVESYAVTFAKGATAKWQIGKFQGGKYQTAYSIK